MKKKKKTIIIVFIIIIIIVIILTSILVPVIIKKTEEKKNVVVDDTPRLYRISTDKIKYKELGMTVFNGTDSDGRHINIALYSNLKCRYIGDENDTIANRKCFYQIDGNKIILSLDYPTKYTHTFTIDKDWKYLEDEKGKYDNYMMNYFKEKNIEKVLVNPINFNTLYYIDSGISIFSNCDENTSDYNPKKCTSDNKLSFKNYDVVDTNDFSRIKPEKSDHPVLLSAHFQTRDYSDYYGGEQHIILLRDRSCKISLEKNGLNVYQDGEYKNCKYEILFNEFHVAISLYADYVEGNNTTKARLYYVSDNKFVDTIGSFEDYYSPSHRRFSVISETEYDKFKETIKFVEEITPDYKLHDSSSNDDSNWWGPVKISDCRNENLDVILKRLASKYKVEIYKGTDYVNLNKNIVLLSNDKYKAYIELRNTSVDDGYYSYLADDVDVFDKDGDLHRNTIGVLVGDTDATIYDVLCNN